MDGEEMFVTTPRQPAGSRGLGAGKAAPMVRSGPKTAEKPANRQKTASGDVVLAAMSEREFQTVVVRGLRQRGWLCFIVPDMRKTLAGLPDLLCLHAGRDVMLAWELKTMKGKPTPIQSAVLALLDRIPGVDARIVRPSDWYALSEVI